METPKRDRKEFYLVFYNIGEAGTVGVNYTEKFVDMIGADKRARELAAKHMGTPIYICSPVLKITGTASIEKEFIY
jgi:hypothetical protein